MWRGDDAAAGSRLDELPWEELAFPADAAALRDVAASASDAVALGASGTPLGGVLS